MQQGEAERVCLGVVSHVRQAQDLHRHVVRSGGLVGLERAEGAKQLLHRKRTIEVEPLGAAQGGLALPARARVDDVPRVILRFCARSPDQISEVARPYRRGACMIEDQLAILVRDRRARRRCQRRSAARLRQ